MKAKNTKTTVISPLLRWAGGKSWMVNQINSLMINQYKNYHEPFIGGGSVFFNIERQRKSFISDSNRELICFYQHVKENLNDLLHVLKQFKNTEKEYYKIRSW